MRIAWLLGLTVLLPGAGLVAIAAGSIRAEERLLEAQREARRRDLGRAVREAVRERVSSRLAALSERLTGLVERGEDPARLHAADPGALALDADLRLLAPAPAWRSGGADLPAPPAWLLPALQREAQGDAEGALASLAALGTSHGGDPATLAVRARSLARAGRAAEALAADRELAALERAGALRRRFARERALERLLELGRRDEAAREAEAALAALLGPAGAGASAASTWDGLARAAGRVRELAGDTAVPSSAAAMLCLARAAADLELLAPPGLAALPRLGPDQALASLAAGTEGGGTGWLVVGPPGLGGTRAALLLPRPELAALVAEASAERAGGEASELAVVLAEEGEELGAGLALAVELRETALGRDLARRRALSRVLLLLGLVLMILVGSGLAWRSVRREAELARLRADFVASVTHELRTPVTSIRAMAEVLGLGKLEGPRQGEYYRAISAEARRLGRRIEDVLDAARLEQGALHARPEAVDLATAAEAAREALAPAAEAAGMRIELAPAGELPAARVDPALLERALENLLDNALKHGRPPEGEPDPGRRVVTLRVGAEGGAPWVAVEDRGPGIPAHEQPRVFQRYFRGSAAVERPGAGLGLAIVDSIAQAHGGRVALVSRPGQTTFTLHLPAWQTS